MELQHACAEALAENIDRPHPRSELIFASISDYKGRTIVIVVTCSASISLLVLYHLAYGNHSIECSRCQVLDILGNHN